MVRAAAREAFDDVKTNLAALDSRRLLRASAEPEDKPDELLRAAGPGDTPQEQLLRPSEPDHGG